MNVIELFPCSGGMAEGLRRAGIEVTQAFDFDAEACASYEQNLGHKPVRMDVRDLVEMTHAGWSPGHVDLLVADPPCTPWSRAGKRQGTEDEHDMLLETVALVRLWRPRFWVIANVPGLDDAPNWPVVQRHIGGLAAYGWCIDFMRLDAANYGVPQHRVRPFWVGHPMSGEHIAMPPRTHGPPGGERQGQLVPALLPWVTCRKALEHLPLAELGHPVRLRWRGANGAQVASVPDAPAHTVGTSNLSDGNVLAHPDDAVRPAGKKHRPSKKPRATPVDEPAGTVTTTTNGNGGTVYDELALRVRGDGTVRESQVDEPAHTIRGGKSSSERLVVDRVSESWMDAPSKLDAPARTVRSAPRGEQLMEVPHHPVNEPDQPARTVCGADGTTGSKVLRAHAKHPPNAPDAPSVTIAAKDRGGQGAAVLEWPWDRASTTVCARDVIPPPGHHPESGSILSQPNAVKLSEKAAALLQGFPERWKFVGKTKRARWSQIGMAMPPALAEAVGRQLAKLLHAGSSSATRSAS